MSSCRIVFSRKIGEGVTWVTASPFRDRINRNPIFFGPQFIYLFNLSREVEESVPEPKKTEWTEHPVLSADCCVQSPSPWQTLLHCWTPGIWNPGPKTSDPRTKNIRSPDQKHPIPGQKHPIPGQKLPIPGPIINILNSFPILAS